jgi:hypothetical protein
VAVTGKADITGTITRRAADHPSKSMAERSLEPNR